MRYRGLTWDHPRGYHALAAAAGTLDKATDGLAITWDRQPLEGFETHPIADLCARYDLIVLDHPHVGEAVACEGLIPLESLFDATEIASWGAAAIGRSLASYHYAGRHWALPLDAATQVMAVRPDLVDAPLPETWDEVLALAARAPVALSLAGPHAALSFQSIAAAIDGHAPRDPDRFVGEDTGRAVLAIMAPLAAATPDAVRRLNPIGLLETMTQGDTVALCPLVYGYVNYTQAIAFADVPVARPGGRRGSTLGGTGIGISARTEVTPALLDHLRWLMSDTAQRGFIPVHDGQPSRRDAWADDAVNARHGDFYRNTARTIEQAYVRPRFDGAIAFQTVASALIRDGLTAGTSHAAMLATVQDAYHRHRPAGAEL